MLGISVRTCVHGFYLSFPEFNSIATIDFPNESSATGSSFSDSVLSASLFKPLLFLSIVLSILMNPAHIFPDGSTMEVGLDWQVMIKLLVSGFASVMGLWGLMELPQARRAVMSLPAMAILTILVFALPASLTGSSMSSLPATLINIAYVAVIASAIVSLGWQQILVAVLVGVGAASIGSWLMYFFIPSYGIYPEFLGNVTVERLGGMSHPNMVGRSAGVGILISFGLWRNRKITLMLFGVLLAMFAVTLIYSVSRTAMIATFIGLITMHLQQFKTRDGLRVIAAGLFFLLVGVIALGMTGKEATVLEKFGSSVSKTGDSRELTTGTGRSEIWLASIDLIKESPVTGYGFGAAQELLEDHSQSTHNIVLNAALISGVVGGIIMFGLYILLFFIAVNSRIPAIATLAVFLMVSGLVEDTVLETFPAAGTMMWILCCLLPIREQPSDETTDTGAQSSENFGQPEFQ